MISPYSKGFSEKIRKLHQILLNNAFKSNITILRSILTNIKSESSASSNNESYSLPCEWGNLYVEKRKEHEIATVWHEFVKSDLARYAWLENHESKEQAQKIHKVVWTSITSNRNLISVNVLPWTHSRIWLIGNRCPLNHNINSVYPKKNRCETIFF